MILIVTHSWDISSDLVIRHLLRRNATFVRLDTDKLGTEGCHFGYRNEPELILHGSVYLASQFTSIWARRFSLPTSLTQVPDTYRDFVRRELSVVMDAFLEAPSGALQVNPSEVDRISGNRLLQMQRAKDLGFLTPETLVTQDFWSAQNFISKHPRPITKALSFGHFSSNETSESSISFASIFSEENHLDGLSICPSLFQGQLIKKADWRVTTVGTRVFSAKIPHLGTDKGIDWRKYSGSALRFEKCELPVDIQERILELCKISGLVFGAHDLVETVSGEFYFLETNPAGQWGWLEMSLGLQIGQALADVLSAPRIRG